MPGAVETALGVPIHTVEAAVSGARARARVPSPRLTRSQVLSRLKVGVLAMGIGNARAAEDLTTPLGARFITALPPSQLDRLEERLM